MGWMRLPGALGRIPDLFIRNRLHFTFDGAPVSSAALSYRQRLNLIKAGIDMMLRRNRVFALPAVVQIEPTNVCNLQCPICPTGSNECGRPRGFMSLETFQRILDEIGDSLILAVLYGWGEPFLNKNLPRMIGECTARNIRTMTSTNGHCLQTLDEALQVVDAGLSLLVIALDGSTQEIYGTYRKGGNVEKVKRCAALIEEAKAKRGSPLPYTNLRVVVTRNNYQDLGNLEKIARDSRINMFSYKSLGCLVQTAEFINFEPEVENLCRFPSSATERRSVVRCPYPFRQPTVFWDGTLVGCEFDLDLDFPYGKLDYRNLWNSSTALHVRRAVRGDLPQPRFCRRCPYRGRTQDSCILSHVELRPPDFSSGSGQNGHRRFGSCTVSPTR